VDAAKTPTQHPGATTLPDRPAAVRVEGVSKTFRIPKEQIHTLKERALHPLRRTTYNNFHALDDVSLSVGSGEFFAVVGRNGSGKSTLLKCLAAIYTTDRGAIYIDGRVSTFIELGVGFDPDLAARDNVKINAAMLGLGRREARRRFDAIIDFAELGEFTDLKIKNYSSGMLVRLAFSVMVEVEADVLLIDEVLAVGDAAFQQKCFDKFEAIRAGNRTVLLVTHAMDAVQRFCNRAMLIEHGRVVCSGDPETVSNRYLDLNFSELARAEAETRSSNRDGQETATPSDATFGDGRAVIEDAWFESTSGERTSIIHNGNRATFTMRVRFTAEAQDPVFGVTLRNGARIPLFTASSGWEIQRTGRFAAGEEVLWRVTFDNTLGPDRFTATPTVTLGGGATLAVHERMLSIVVTRTAPTGALIDIPFSQDIERMTPVGVEQDVVR
jgi:ABC-type polysaccharide/polyol phosphate transport system ATPase subunit